MHPTSRTLLLASVLLTSLLPPLASAAEACADAHPASYVSPQGRTQSPYGQIVGDFADATPGCTITTARMFLDGLEVPAETEHLGETFRIFYYPTIPTLPGPHEVRVELDMTCCAILTHTWDFYVLVKQGEPIQYDGGIVGVSSFIPLPDSANVPGYGEIPLPGGEVFLEVSPVPFTIWADPYRTSEPNALCPEGCPTPDADAYATGPLVVQLSLRVGDHSVEQTITVPLTP